MTGKEGNYNVTGTKRERDRKQDDKGRTEGGRERKPHTQIQGGEERDSGGGGGTR